MHVIINNQVGFTTAPASSRSSVYCHRRRQGSIQAPIFHVNGDDPEAVRAGRPARLRVPPGSSTRTSSSTWSATAAAGHNEGDDPSMTQPLMYNLIEAKRSRPQALHRGADRPRRHHRRGGRGRAARLPGAARAGLRRDPRRRPAPIPSVTADVDRRPTSSSPVAAGSDDAHGRPAPDRRRPERCSSGSATPTCSPPAGFTVHPKLQQLLEKRDADVPRRRHRLGLRRAARARLAAHGGQSGPPGRPGLPPRHLRAAARGPPRPG